MMATRPCYRLCDGNGTLSSLLLTITAALIFIIAFGVTLQEPLTYTPLPPSYSPKSPRTSDFYRRENSSFSRRKNSSVTGLVRKKTFNNNMEDKDTAVGSKERNRSILAQIKKYYLTLIQRFKGPFLRDYKSPCIRENNGVKCLPYFYLAGVSKSGTTDLWMNILRHPQVVNRVKEGSWWAEGKKTYNGISNYLKVQNSLVQRASKSSTSQRSLIIGDASANTLWCNKQIMTDTRTRQRGELPFVWADVIHTVQPGAKIIAILRQPTDRTISGYFAFHRERRKSPQDFHNRVKKGIELFKSCLKKRSLRTCANLDYYPRIQVGVYIAHVQEWLRVYPRKQLLLMRTEDWHKHPNTNLLASVFKFLEIEPKTEKELRPLKKSGEFSHIANKQATSKGENKYGHIFPATRRMLDDFYRPYNEQLAKLLSDDNFLWKDKPS